MSSPEDRPVVLVVDDDEPLREAICDTLQAAGFRTRAAADAGQALAAAARAHPPPKAAARVQRHHAADRANQAQSSSLPRHSG